MYFSSEFFRFFAGFRLFFLFIVAVAVGCMVSVVDPVQAGLFSNISGVYVASYKNGVAMIHLVETPDHHLTGNHMLVVIDEKGEVLRNNSAVTGAVDGSNISLNFPHGTKSFTAVLAGDTLRVIGLDESPTVFQKSDLDEFEKKATMINATSQSLLLRKSEEEKKNKFVSDVGNLNSSMDNFVKASDDITQKLSETEERLQKITTKMASLLEKERQLADNKNAGSAQMELVSSIMEGRSVTQSLQWDVNALQTKIRNHQQATYDRVDGMERECHNSSGLSACEKFLQSLPRYREKYSIVKRRISSWETVYNKEKPSQDQIFEQAQAVQNERYRK